jgi:hypothetical protein
VEATAEVGRAVCDATPNFFVICVSDACYGGQLLQPHFAAAAVSSSECDGSATCIGADAHLLCECCAAGRMLEFGWPWPCIACWLAGYHAVHPAVWACAPLRWVLGHRGCLLKSLYTFISVTCINAYTSWQHLSFTVGHLLQAVHHAAALMGALFAGILLSLLCCACALFSHQRMAWLISNHASVQLLHWTLELVCKMGH